MELKKIYQRVLDDDGVAVVISTGKLKGKILLEKDDAGHPIIDYVTVTRVGDVGTRQNFSTKRMLEYAEMGLSKIDKGIMTLGTVPELKFKIIRSPGRYCCHDDHPCGNGKEALAYIQEHFAGIDSPDPSNPSGYRKDNYYATERVA